MNQKIWDEVGEPDAEREAVLLEIEEECLEVYRSKIDEAKKCRLWMQQQIAKFQAEFADTCFVMGEQPAPHVRLVCRNKSVSVRSYFLLFDMLQRNSK